MDDAQLLRRYWKEGSEAAFAELVRRHLQLVYFAALRQVGGDAHRAQDVSQAVFTKLARKARSLDHRPSVAGWLYLTTRFEARHTVRTERRRQIREQEAYDMNQLQPIQEPAPDWDRLRPVIDDVLCTLGELDREVLLLRFFHRSPFVEIGARVGLSADTARFRLDRALNKVRARLAERGIDSTSDAIARAFAEQEEAAPPAGVAALIAGTALVAAGKHSALAALIHLMSTTKTLVAAGALVSLLAVGLSWHEHTVNQHTETALARAKQNLQNSQAQIVRLQSQTRRGENLSETQRQGAGGLPGAGGKDRASSSQGAAASSTRQAGLPSGQPVNRPLSNNPEVRAALAGWIKPNLDLELGPFFRARGYSPEKIDVLENLLLKEDINMGPNELLTLRPESESEGQVPQEIKALLGDTDYPQFQEFHRTAALGEIAAGLAGNLYDTAEPLTAEQGQQLTDILVQANASNQRSGPAMPSMVNWDAALVQAQKILSPTQFTVFQNEASLLSSQSSTSGWSGLNDLIPGSIGQNPGPPALTSSQ